MRKTTSYRRATYVIASFMLVLSAVLIGVNNVAAFAGGDGSVGAPYQVASWSDLHDVRNNLTANYILTTDLDQNSAGYATYASDSANANSGWLPIGNSSTRFQGTFDGNDHTIDGLNIDRSGTGYNGLFGATSGSATISDLTLKNPAINGGGQTGGIVGQNQGTITGVHVENPVIVATSSAGGVVGQNSSGAITLSSTKDGTVASMNAWGGGLVGLLNGGSISRSWSSAAVSANNDAGGLTGHSGNGTIQNSYSTGNVTSYNASSENSFGGMAGVAGNITNAYASGNVTISGTGPNSGGLYGESGSVTSNSFATGTVTGTAPIGGFGGLSGGSHTNSYSVFGTPIGSGNSTGVSDVTNSTVFMGVNHTHAVYASWDFETIWEAHDGALPTLRGNVEEELYTITFDTQGGSAVASMTNLSQGDGIMLPAAPTRSGYVFVAWNTAANGSGTAKGQNAEYVVPGNNMTFYAIWEVEGDDPDNDGISDGVEDAGPNSGDGNDDGTPDSEQSHVTSLKSPVNDNYISLEVDEGCTLESVASVAESSKVVQDSGYSYPAGLLNFTANCEETTVRVFFYGESNATVRKYNPNTNAYFTIAGATKSAQTIDGKAVTVVTYTVQDNGDLDMDGEDNGVIVDPVGLGVLSVNSPNTGVVSILDLLYVQYGTR